MSPLNSYEAKERVKKCAATRVTAAIFLFLLVFFFCTQSAVRSPLALKTGRHRPGLRIADSCQKREQEINQLLLGSPFALGGRHLENMNDREFGERGRGRRHRRQRAEAALNIDVILRFLLVSGTSGVFLYFFLCLSFVV